MSELSYGALFTPAYPKSYDLLPLAPVICCVPGTAHVLRLSLQFPIMEVKASPKPSQMEAKGVAVLQRGIGDGASEGSSSAEAGYRESTG
jgi:hypothetical protein